MQLFHKRYGKPGSAPGVLLEGPVEGRLETRISVIDYDDNSIEEAGDLSLEECRRFFYSDKTTWVHVQGDPPPAVLEFFGEAYQLHPLALEDIVNTGQRPKSEFFDQQLFLVLGLPGKKNGHLFSGQVSIFLSGTAVVSFHHGPHDVFEPVRHRIRTEPPRRIRSRGADYLVYALVDLVIDLMFPLLEELGDRLEELEDLAFSSPSPETLDGIHTVKRDLLLLRRVLWPQREAINTLVRDGRSLLQDETQVYLRDCYDHTVQIMELIESYREMASSLLEVYLSSLSNRMNDVMKVLTIIATIFIPLSFLVGVYGMNFNPAASPWNMPELNLRYGYPALWLIMIVIVGGMLALFRRKGWF